MKKLFVFAASAMMVFASCTDNEIVYQNETPQEISFFSVANKMTRAAIDGTTFEHDNMAVAAFLAGGTGVTKGDFFNGKTFERVGETANFTGGKYWPIQASTLNFLAVAPVETGVSTVFGSKASDDAPISNFAGKAVVTLTSNETNQYDVMYANASKSKSNAAREDLTVGMIFKHALAWVNFTFQATSPGITINKVTVNGADYNGTLTITNAGFNATTGMTLTPVWSYQSGLAAVEGVVPGKDVIIDNNQTKELTIDEDEIASDKITWGKGLLVVPCNPTNFVINYSVKVGDDTHTYNYTYPITAPEEGTAWVMGTKYNYNISMGLQEIKIAPTVVDWTDSENPVDIK